MKVEFLNPFVVAAQTTCLTMLSLQARPGKLTLKHDAATTVADITAILGLSGKLRGSIVLAFEQPVAERFVARFLGTQGALPINEVCDGIGELCNIVGGSAKAELNKLKLDLSISIPNVIVGKGLRVALSTNYRTHTLIVPFETEIGSFMVEICLVDN